MAQYEWSECFGSVEGEAAYTGYPTFYIRFSRCNFSCKGFNNPEMLDTSDVNVLGFNPKDYTNINDIPSIAKGCDSIYAVHPMFQHMWHIGDENLLAQEVVNLLPSQQWSNPVSGLPIILSLTGGEPTLRAKTIPTLLDHPLMNDLKILLIETNCSVPLPDSFINYLIDWQRKPGRKVIWSNSPKLSSSGEEWNKAIKPKVALSQLKTNISTPMEQYFKFVCGPNDKDFDEVAKAMNEYHEAGIPKNTRVYIMPVACLEEQQQAIAAQVAQMCIDRGYIYCHRVHATIFGNTVGT